MTHVFVWTVGDVVGLVMFGLMLLCVGSVTLYCWIEDRAARTRRQRKVKP